MVYIPKVFADYNLLSPDDINAMVFSKYRQALGKETVERISRQLENYDYYSGKQHRNEYGALVKASELPRPPGVDYDPTRYATNYFKAIVDRKARWQMSGKHGISVPRRQIDAIEDVLREDYEPSEAQRRENERAEEYERLLYQLWDENRMRAKLVQAARDRLIADRVVCKIVYNDRTGKLRWIFRPDNEYIPVYSDDDFEDLIGAYFIKNKDYEINGEEVPAILIQEYRLVNGMAYLHEGIYRESDLALLEELSPSADLIEGYKETQRVKLIGLKPKEQDKKLDELAKRVYPELDKRRYLPLGLDFIPVQEFPVSELLSESIGDSEISALREQNDVLNQMNEDAIDSLKFEMFEITAITNATPGAADNFVVAPGSVVEIQSQGDSKSADIKKVVGSFGWKEAFKDQYMRVKGAMHEISGLPQIVPQELNFGGLNGEALQVLFHDIITDTEEHWLSWGYNLAELHAKSIRYLQARVSRPRFSYDRQVVMNIGDNYTNEMRFVLPLPDNRKELVELLEMETLAGFESTKGAMERLGVENIQAKQQEIESERTRKRNSSAVSYGEEVEEIDGE